MGASVAAAGAGAKRVRQDATAARGANADHRRDGRLGGDDRRAAALAARARGRGVARRRCADRRRRRQERAAMAGGQARGRRRVAGGTHCARRRHRLRRGAADAATLSRRHRGAPLRRRSRVAALQPGRDRGPRREDAPRRRALSLHHLRAPQRRAHAGPRHCIFLHVWRDARSATVGCTAMALDDLRALLGWVDSSTELVQLPRDEYARRQRGWDLPQRK